MILKPLFAIGLTAVVALTVAGCSFPATSNNVTEEPISNTAVCSGDSTASLGDVVAQDTVKDEFGEYCKVTVDSNIPAFKFDSSKVSLDALSSAGFTEEDIMAAQETTLKFVAEQVLDSTRLDNSTSAPEVWLAENGAYFEATNLELMTPYVKEKGLSPYNLIITDVFPSPLSRNGDARISSINVEVNDITLNQAEGNDLPTILVSVSGKAVYPVSNSYIVETILKNDTSQTEESLRTSSPQLFNEETDIDLVVQGTFNYAFLKETPSLISGVGAKWSMKTTDGIPVVG